jgi:hypothetical protein
MSEEFTGQPPSSRPLWRRRGPWAPAIIWGASFAVSQTLLHGFRWWIPVTVASALAAGASIGVALNALRNRRDEVRRQKHPYWLT